MVDGEDMVEEEVGVEAMVVVVDGVDGDGGVARLITLEMMR